jgi:phosphate starvation-inducible protein PhoH
MQKSRRTRQKDGMADIYLIDSNNKRAIAEGPTRKHWSKHDIKGIKPLTENQHNMFTQYFQGDQLVAYGSAGTGKTYLACYLAMCDILDGSLPQKQLVVVRSAVATRDLGFMPGTLEEKTSLFEIPYRDILADLFGRPATYDNMKEAGLVRFVTTSYIRGLTWDNSIIIVDEAQNLTWHEINSVMTRIGENSRIVFTGDLIQTDLNKKTSEKTGMQRLLATTGKMPQFSTVQFTSSDIVRSELVKDWIIASEQTED